MVYSAAGIAHEPYAAGPSRFPGCAWGYLGGMVFSNAGIAHEPYAAGPSRFPGYAWGYLGGMVFSAAGTAHEPRAGLPETITPCQARSPPAYGTVLWGD